MNWEEIKKENPKAFALLLKETTEYEIMDGEYIHTDNLRSLYEFFDEQRIYITLKYVDLWDYTISDGTGHLLDTDYDYKDTRQRSEAAAFTKSFQILEKRL